MLARSDATGDEQRAVVAMWKGLAKRLAKDTHLDTRLAKDTHLDTHLAKDTHLDTRLATATGPVRPLGEAHNRSSHHQRRK